MYLMVVNVQNISKIVI